MWQLVLSFLLPGISQFFSTIIPIILLCLGGLIQFSLTRLSKIPLYIQVLIRIYQDSESNSKVKKYATTGLLILGGILSFLANSLVPFTALPVIGLITGPLAILLSLTVILLTMDLIISIDKVFFREMQVRYGNNFQEIEDDILTLKTELGPKWDKLHTQTKIFFDNISPKIDELENELAKQGISFSNEINKYFQNELSDLVIYLSEQEASNIQVSHLDINHIKESLEPWEKVSSSLVLGATGGGLAGLGTAGATTSIFAQATLGNQILALLGLKGGILVSASAYAMLTTITPIAVGLGLGAGIFSGSMVLFQKNEEKKASKFLGDIIIAALPIMYADGYIDPKEKDAIYQMMNNSTLQKEDKERVKKSIDSKHSLDELVVMGVFNEQKKEKREIKRKLILTLAWEIAKSDNHIHSSEIDLHNRMAKIMQVSEENVNEIRRLITPRLFLLPTDNSSQNLQSKTKETKNLNIEVEVIQVIPNESKYQSINDLPNKLKDNQDNLEKNVESNVQSLTFNTPQIETKESNLPEKIEIVNTLNSLNESEEVKNIVDPIIDLNTGNSSIEEKIARIVNQKVQQAINLEKEKQEKEIIIFEAKKKEKIAIQKQYKKLVYKKLDDLQERLSNNKITSSQYELELKEIRSHIDFLNQAFNINS